MAALSTQNRQAVCLEIQRNASTAREALPVTKADLIAAVNAVDDWIEANTAAFNAAIPQPARAALTVNQKYRLLQYVINKRLGG